MATKGLYVQRLSDGRIHGVQVVDDAGMEWSMLPQDYINRGHKPPIGELPDLEEHQKSKKVP